MSLNQNYTINDGYKIIELFAAILGITATMMIASLVYIFVYGVLE